MIDVPLMHKLIQALPESAHLLIVGDVDQLSGRVRRWPSPFATIVARKDFQAYTTDLSQAKLILAGDPIATKCESVSSQFNNGFARRMVGSHVQQEKIRI